MNCDFAEKVSTLIDGELPAAEIEAVRAHVTACADCRELEKDFLFFRRQIKSPAPDSAEIAPGNISAFPAERRTTIWKRRILLPVPALVLFVFGVVGLGAWLISSRLGESSVETTQTAVKNAAPKIEKQPNEDSLARYDAGGRAEIYVLPKRAK